MKTKEFQALLDELDGFSPIQRAALTTALKTSGSAADVLGLLEAEIDKLPTCGHCSSERVARWGAATGMRRCRCELCGRTFNALTGTPPAHLQKREKWLDYVRAIVDGLTLIKAAALVGVHLETSFRWRHQFVATSKKAKPWRRAGTFEADETFILKSAEGSPGSIGRAPRNSDASPRRQVRRRTTTISF